MITNEEARKAVETLKEHVDQQLDCYDCIFNNKMLESDFCYRYFKACIRDWNLKILKKDEKDVQEAEQELSDLDEYFLYADDYNGENDDDIS